MGCFDEQHMGPEDAEEPDDLDLDLAERLEDPEFAAGFEDAAARAGLLAACLERRKDAGLTQAAVAEAMDTTQSAISELEGGATDPRLSTIQRYARAIGCRLDLQLCTGSPTSGWRRLGVDVHYSSHEHRLPTWQFKEPGHWEIRHLKDDRWIGNIWVHRPTAGGHAAARQAVAGR